MEQMTNRKYLILLIILILITTSSAVIPASWFGINTKKSDTTPDLTSVVGVNAVNKNKETGAPATWKDLTNQAFKDSPQALEEFKNTPIDEKSLDNLNDPDNLTASFSKNLYIASTYLNENGGGDVTEQQDILDQLMKQEAAKIIPTTYLSKDINVAKAESKDSIKAYGNNLALILKDTITEASIKSDLNAVADYLSANNANSIEIINSDYERVDAKLKKLLALPVPLSASTYHIITVNQIAAYRDNLYNLSKLAEDPLRARIAFEKYAEVSLNTLSIYKDFSKYFDTKNIVFSSKEGGYVFTAGYTIK